MSEFETYKKQRAELFNVKQPEKDDPIQENTSTQPMTFSGKLSNYWYHYKRMTLGGAFAVIVLAFFLFQVFYHPPYDASLMIVSSAVGLDAAMNETRTALAPFVETVTGKKNNDIDLSSVWVESGEAVALSGQQAEGNFAKLIERISGNTGFLYLVDQTGYENLRDYGLTFVNLSSLPGAQGHLAGQDQYLLKDTAFFEMLDYELSRNYPLEDEDAEVLSAPGVLFEPMYLCIVDIAAFPENVRKKESVQAVYNRDLDFLKHVLSYTKARI